MTSELASEEQFQKLTGSNMFNGQYFTIIHKNVINAYSKWMDVHIMTLVTTQVTTDRFRSTFATVGLPNMLVTNNGTSADFDSFLIWNGICHLCSSPNHPASNGLAERAVRHLQKVCYRQGWHIFVQLSNDPPVNHWSVIG